LPIYHAILVARAQPADYFAKFGFSTAGFAAARCSADTLATTHFAFARTAHLEWMLRESATQLDEWPV
jgi:hypothetical protein